MQLSWAKMPSKWIVIGKLKNLNANKNVAVNIAVIKIYILICIRLAPSDNPKNSCAITYDEISSVANLSRTVISGALKWLIANNIIEATGRRVRIYTIPNYNNPGWCKFPIRDVVDKGGEINFFKMISNRHPVELHALKLLVYLLAIRGNDDEYSEVSLSKIISKIGINYKDIFPALTLLKVLGLVSDFQRETLPQRGININLMEYKQDEILDVYFPYGSYLPKSTRRTISMPALTV